MKMLIFLIFLVGTKKMDIDLHKFIWSFSTLVREEEVSAEDALDEILALINYRSFNGIWDCEHPVNIDNKCYEKAYNFLKNIPTDTELNIFYKN